MKIVFVFIYSKFNEYLLVKREREIENFIFLKKLFLLY